MIARRDSKNRSRFTDRVNDNGRREESAVIRGEDGEAVKVSVSGSSHSRVGSQERTTSEVVSK